MKTKKHTKRHAKAQRNPALVPVPEKFAALLKLVNLLPGCIRHPYWARLDKNFEELNGLHHRIEELLDWRPYAESQIAFIARQLHREITKEYSRNTPSYLWIRLSFILDQLPLLLLAFVLNDDNGKYYERDDGQGAITLTPISIDPDYQLELNFKVLTFNEDELKKLVRVSVKRIELALLHEVKERAPDEIRIAFAPRVEIEGSTYELPNAGSLLLKVRQRLIYVMAAQELVSCLTHPSPREQLLWHCQVVPKSEAARPIPYIKEGKFTLRTPPLFSYLEGIETRRVRECQICYQFFWAGRIDMKCCSAKCSHALRSRNYRRAYKEKYAYQRYLKSKNEEKSLGEDVIERGQNLPTRESRKITKPKSR